MWISFYTKRLRHLVHFDTNENLDIFSPAPLLSKYRVNIQDKCPLGVHNWGLSSFGDEKIDLRSSLSSLKNILVNKTCRSCYLANKLQITLILSIYDIVMSLKCVLVCLYQALQLSKKRLSERIPLCIQREAKWSIGGFW